METNWAGILFMYGSIFVFCILCYFYNKPIRGDADDIIRRRELKEKMDRPYDWFIG